MTRPITIAEAVCQKVAEAFSRMEKPEFEPGDRPDLLSQVFIGDPGGLEKLDEAVKELSRGKVRVKEPAKKDKFNLEVMGSARYLVLVGNGRRQRVIYTPGHPHFIFEK